MTCLEIPDHPDKLTTAWLTEALRSTGAIDQAAVTALQVESMGGVEGTTGPMARVRLSYDRPTENGPTTLLAKFPDVDPEKRLALSQLRLYELEARFYDEISEQVKLRTPICYYSAMDLVHNEYVLLLEDLAPAQPGNQVAGCSIEQAKMAVLALVELHAPYWDCPTLKDLTWAPTFPELAQTFQQSYLESLWPAFVEKYRQSLPDYTMEIGEAFGQAIPSIWNQLGQSPITVIHGDYRLDNMLFGSTEGEPPFSVVDWQLIKLGRGVIDMAYFLGWSVDLDMRRANEMDLLRTYHTALMQKGIRDYSFDQCLQDYRQSMFYLFSLLVTGLAIVDFSSEKQAVLAATMIERAVASLQDHNVKDLLPG